MSQLNRADPRLHNRPIRGPPAGNSTFWGPTYTSRITYISNSGTVGKFMLRGSRTQRRWGKLKGKKYNLQGSTNSAIRNSVLAVTSSQWGSMWIGFSGVHIIWNELKFCMINCWKLVNSAFSGSRFQRFRITRVLSVREWPFLSLWEEPTYPLISASVGFVWISGFLSIHNLLLDKFFLMHLAEFQKLWRGVPVDSIDEEKIDEYLKKQGITSMQETGPKKVVSVTVSPIWHLYLLWTLKYQTFPPCFIALF